MGAVQGTLGRLDRSPALSPERQEQLLRQLDVFLRSLTQVSQRADRLLARIEAGEGGAGKAFQDAELVEDLKAVLKELRTNPFQLLLPESEASKAR
jgi:phospholipid/cholesterol/gamma-HCH transport system substrate-binding protein